MQATALPFADLVENVVKLDFREYKKFVQTVNTLRARQRRTDVLSAEETELLKKIYLPFPKSKNERLETLNAKIWDETLTETEHAELLKLIEAKEKWAAVRLERMAKLATLRNIDYPSLLRQLDIPTA